MNGLVKNKKSLALIMIITIAAAEYLNGNIEKIIRKEQFSKEDLFKDIKRALDKIGDCPKMMVDDEKYSLEGAIGKQRRSSATGGAES